MSVSPASGSLLPAALAAQTTEPGYRVGIVSESGDIVTWLQPSNEDLIMKTVAADPDDSFGGRARDSVTGWWGRSRRFLSEVRNEMGRVTWPSRKEVYATTLVVILFSVVMGVYLWVVDLTLDALIRSVYRSLGGACSRVRFSVVPQ